MNNYQKNGIKSWAEDDRPREKLLLKGTSSLSDAELLAILIGSGTKNSTAVDLAKQILAKAGNSLNELAKQSNQDLQKTKGIGEARAITIVAALELGRRRKEADIDEKPLITSSNDARDIMHPILADLPHEEFWVLLLNRANRVIDKIRISQGGISGTVIDNRIILKRAIDKLASGMIVSHNHPSGNPKPSGADIEITRKLKESGKIMDISLLDHVIICDNSYFSFADEGLM
jgi:DNA repair protein RadC